MYIVILILTLALLYDFRQSRIPNYLFVLGVLIIQLQIVYTGGFMSGIVALWKGSIILLSLFILFAIGVLGAGDIKMLVLISQLWPLRETYKLVWIMFLMAAVIGAIRLWAEHQLICRVTIFLRYIQQVMVTGKLTVYDKFEAYSNGLIANNQIHFMLPIFITVGLKIGGIID